MQFEIRRCGREEWGKFSRYHYLNTQLNNAATCYGCYHNGDIIGFMGILHFPHPANSKIKRVTRLVVLPAYQGIGIGRKFLEEIAKLYTAEGYSFMIATAARNLIYALKNSEHWSCHRYGIATYSNSNKYPSLNCTTRKNNKTACFFYKS